MKNELNLYGLYKMANGLHFTGVVSTTEENLITYLNTHYTKTLTWADGHEEVVPNWDEKFFVIKKIDVELV